MRIVKNQHSAGILYFLCRIFIVRRFSIDVNRRICYDNGEESRSQADMEVVGMAYRIAVVDDHPVQLLQVTELARRYARQYGCDVTVSAFASVFNLDEKVNYDAYLLDIDMPGLGGIDFARRLRQQGSTCSIVFVSAMESAVFEALRLLPLRFVRKSSLAADMAEAMQALCAQLEKSSRETVLLHHQGGSERVPVREILYVQSLNKHQQVILSGGQMEVRLTMAELERLLLPHGFIRAHRYYLVNMACVRRLFGGEIVLDNGARLPVSRMKTEEVRKALGKAVLR